MVIDPVGIYQSRRPRVLRRSTSLLLNIMDSTRSVHARFPTLFRSTNSWLHDDVIKLEHFPRYWPFEREIHRSQLNSHHKGQWRGALMLSLICNWIDSWTNNGEAGDLRCHRAHYDVIVMFPHKTLEHKHIKMLTHRITFFTTSES